MVQDDTPTPIYQAYYQMEVHVPLSVSDQNGGLLLQ